MPAPRAKHTPRRHLASCKVYRQEQQEPYAEHTKPRPKQYSTSKRTFYQLSSRYRSTTPTLSLGSSRASTWRTL
ncbi:hypothetical protein COCCADRAFT_112947 [Bipolaris zeicola 26-R-13]|uniref:Uncharacterized protein n=1 Tax=Cochliobolus carbonum (strain 26-R-13) TaxID=930089 RepID=W6Y6L7_COCC2|nr:uncharacterized protein COCCADRAFT_112947 [Bipolaris zeicola 26-R-13]EUC26946.1 hypothetical protein COCCADRAFT_112947 [Bipolaris zeicola 26-R-13]